MPDLPGIVTAALIGWISGLLVSLPIGPINLSIINEGVRRGFTSALMIGAGAILMDTIYCSIAFMGFGSFFHDKTIRAVMELVSFLLMLFLGLKYFRARTIEEHNPAADRIEEKLHPHSAFMIGFVRVLGNPGVLLLWITVTAAFISHEWVATGNREKLACISGVTAGLATWVFLLSYIVSRRHKKLSPQTLLRMEHFSGACLLLIAVVIGIRLISLLRKI